jgi:hypothetical protein
VPASHVTVFPHGGWVIDRPPQIDHARHNLQLAFNCGALGYGPIAAHGHADALSVWLSVNGVPLLIDPGTGTYHEDARIRSYFRSTRAHNTLVIDDMDQSVQTGPTIWRDHAPVRLEHAALPPGGIARGTHLGYRRLRDPVTHERTIVRCELRAYLVLDRVLGTASHHLCRHWHTLPGTRVTLAADSSCLIAYQGEQIRLWWSGAQVRCSAGTPLPMAGTPLHRPFVWSILVHCP